MTLQALEHWNYWNWNSFVAGAVLECNEVRVGGGRIPFSSVLKD